jgi:hypothetical protein
MIVTGIKDEQNAGLVSEVPSRAAIDVILSER